MSIFPFINSKSSRHILMIAGCAAIIGVVLHRQAGIATAQTVDDPVRVTGTLVLAIGNLAEYALPDMKVVLRRDGREDVNTATTSLDGRFNAFAPTPGLYQICWDVGGNRGCSKRVEVGRSTVSVGIVRAVAERPIVFGTVFTGDHRPCWVNDSFFGIDASTRVTGGGFTVRANTRGEYALIGPAPGPFRITARCENGTAGATVTLGSAMLRQDIVLDNRAPRIAELRASDGTRALTRANLGQSLDLEAGTRDPDNDVVEFTWRTLDGSGTLSGSNTGSERWTLPTFDGFQSAYVMARDGKGGFAFKSINIGVGAADLEFSGRALDEISLTPVRNAEVTVGTQTARTNSDGWFLIRTPAQPDDRYVLNIVHPNYALMSRAYDRSASGNTYELVRAQVTTANGDRAITIDDTRSAGPCGAGPDRQERRLRRLVGPTILREEDAQKGEPGDTRRIDDAILDLLKPQSECTPRGAQVRLPANALMDETGNTWTGPLRAAVTTLNPARRAIPGDYQAITSAGDRTEMLSFGALDVRLTDLSGRRLQLRPGIAAEVAIPVSNFQRPSASASIVMWFYDEKTGFWMEEGTAQLQNTPQGWMYVGKTQHFSSINMDVAGNDPATATCVRVEIDSAFAGWSNLTLRAYVSYGGTSVQVKETALDNAQYHAVYRIPFGTSFPPNTLRLELRGTSAGQQVVLLDNIINTDARPKMTGTNLWPPYPYTECGAPIALTPAPGVVPAYGDIDATGRPAFLTGPFGNFNPPDGAQQSADYYAAIDPGGNKDTLGKWWQANGFGADGLGAGNATYVRQAYLNHNDLGFGRDMHCANNGANLACYVTNYGLPDQNPANADAAETLDATKRGATVAMEYDNAAASEERVQFYVFGGGVAGSGRINFADLDGFGPKPVPFLCAVCHGGDATLNANKKVRHGRFREFDLPSFRYSGGRQWDFGQTSLNATELANFAKLNGQVRAAPSGTPIASLISAWYPGGTAGGAAPVLPLPPTGWSSQVSGYHNVYGKGCRTCHVARDEGSSTAFFVFNSASDFSGTSYAVCGFGTPKRRIMPNAVVTYRNFWADTPRAQLYETLTGIAANTCDD